MLLYLADAILLAIICSIPYFVFQLRLHSGRAKNTIYASARYTKGMRKHRD